MGRADTPGASSTSSGDSASAAASSSQKKLLNILNGSGTPTSGMMVDLRSDKSPSLGKGKLLFHHIVFAPHSYLLFVLQASSLLQMPT